MDKEEKTFSADSSQPLKMAVFPRPVLMKTTAGIELTKHEESCVKALRRLAEKWNADDNRLWLFSASGHLHVMMDGDGLYSDTVPNPNPTFDSGGQVNKVNWITEIDIPNDGGDW